MAEDSQKKELEALLQRRDSVRDKKQRIMGRLDGAKQDLGAVDDECLRRKVPPEKLDESIQKLDERFGTAVAGLRADIEAAELGVAPYEAEEV